MNNPCFGCKKPCTADDCKERRQFSEAERRTDRAFQVEIKSAFCANYDEQYAKCLNQYIKDFPQSNQLMMQGIKYAFDYLKNIETRK